MYIISQKSHGKILCYIGVCSNAWRTLEEVTADGCYKKREQAERYADKLNRVEPAYFEVIEIPN